MIYKSFKIKNYMCIGKEIEIEFQSKNLVVITGLNESGKTSILNAITAFDWRNDKNSFVPERKCGWSHLFKYKKSDNKELTIISAKILSRNSELENLILGCNLSDDLKEKFSKWIKDSNNSEEEVVVEIFRDLDKKLYYTDVVSENIDLAMKESKVLEAVIGKLHSILLIQNNRNAFLLKPPGFAFPNEVSVSDETKLQHEILKNIFSQAGCNIFDLLSLKKDDCDAVIEKVNEFMEIGMSEIWKKIISERDFGFALEYDNATKIIKVCAKQFGKKKDFLKVSQSLSVCFMFVAIMLFHPGTFLNGILILVDNPEIGMDRNVQKNLVKMIYNFTKKDSNKNMCIYTTHSPYMLSPKYIRRGHTYVSKRISEFEIYVERYKKFMEKESFPNRYGLVQDAISLDSQFNINTYKNTRVLIVRSMSEYYILSKLLSLRDNIKIIPIVSDDYIKSCISCLIAWNIPWLVICDESKQGCDLFNFIKTEFQTNKRVLSLKKYGGDVKKIMTLDDHKRLIKLFGEESKPEFRSIAKRFFYSKDYIIQSLISELSSEAKERLNLLSKDICSVI